MLLFSVGQKSPIYIIHNFVMLLLFFHYTILQIAKIEQPILVWKHSRLSAVYSLFCLLYIRIYTQLKVMRRNVLMLSYLIDPVLLLLKRSFHKVNTVVKTVLGKLRNIFIKAGDRYFLKNGQCVVDLIRYKMLVIVFISKRITKKDLIDFFCGPSGLFSNFGHEQERVFDCKKVCINFQIAFFQFYYKKIIILFLHITLAYIIIISFIIGIYNNTIIQYLKF